MTQDSTTEVGTLTRTLHVAAPPAVVYDVVSRPEHIRSWWSDDATLPEAVPGAEGEIVFGTPGTADAVTERLTVVEAVPPRTFSFRWTHGPGDPVSPATTLLVTFNLDPAGDGTRLTMTETGFRERGWEIAVLEQTYADHERGWDLFLPRLVAHAEHVAGVS